MTHSIETWRAVLTLADRLAPLTVAAAETELPAAEESDEALVEVSRKYPGLSLEIAAYLAR